MLRALEIYGADRSAFVEDGPFSMGSHLLRLLPEDRWDRQPLRPESGKGWLVADARIDNRERLARELDISGGAAAELADSDFVLKAWERWGEDSVKHLIGAFAFAVWQPELKRLFIARDAVGERPLYFCQAGGLFAFASMPTGLLTLPGVDMSLDEEMLALYVALLPQPPGRTLFKHIQKVAQGHSMTITPDGVSQRPYWRIGDTRELRLRNDAEYLDAFRECFDEAVRCRLRTTGGIGTELSGGLDSSSVTATAAMLLKSEGRGLTAFTHVPRPGVALPNIPNRYGDEGPYAALVTAQYPNIDHVLVPNGGIRIMESLAKHAGTDDQPTFNPTNSVWMDAIVEQARDRGITTVLTGRAGNGTISYDGFLALSEFFRAGRWLKLAKESLALRRTGWASLRKIGGVTILPLLPLALQKRLAPRVGDFSLDYCAVNPELASKYGLTERARFNLNFGTQDVKSDLATYVVSADGGAVFAGVKAGWHVELRDPTADQRVFEFVHSLPVDQFLRDGYMRSVVRRGMKGRVPEETLYRYARGMQTADWHRTIAESLPEIQAELQLLERSPWACRILDLPRLKRMAAEWPTEGLDSQAVLDSYHYAFSRGLGMGVFLRRHDPDFKAEGKR